MTDRGRLTRRSVLVAGAGAFGALAGCSSTGSGGGGGGGASRNTSGIAVRAKPTGDALSELDSLTVHVSSVGIDPRGQSAGRLAAGNTVDVLSNGGDPVEFFVLGFPAHRCTRLSLYGHGGTATKRDGSHASASFANGSALQYDQDYRLRTSETTVFTAGISVTATGSGGYSLAADPSATSVSMHSGRPSSTER